MSTFGDSQRYYFFPETQKKRPIFFSRLGNNPYLHEIRFYLNEIDAYLNDFSRKLNEFCEILNDFSEILAEYFSRLGPS